MAATSSGRKPRKKKSSPRLPTGIKRKNEKKKLLIVESPTKARTIKSYLGKDFEVMASQGHLVDLPKSSLGVDIENGFEPKYIAVRGKAKILRQLREAAKNATQVYLASDPDREGEAIAFHIRNDLAKHTDVPIKRVLFYEITPEEVAKGIGSPGEIDMLKVESQQARRILDRLVGYQISPFLWKIIRGGLSAGRVQTVALRLLAEREKEIAGFIPEKYWVLLAKLRSKKVEFEAKHPQRVPSKREAEDLVEAIKGKSFLVDSFKVSKRKASPPPPHKTSTLQQEASNVFGFSPSKTMLVAQQLYEGVDLPDGRTGLITYMRTDSVRMSSKAITAIRHLITREYGQEYLSKEPRHYADKAKSVQAAHECIRPTDINRTPDEVRGFLTSDQYKVYWLVWRRAVASQAADAQFETHSAKLHPEGLEDLEFRASGRKLLFDGFYKITRDEVKAVPLPAMKEGDRVKLLSIEALEKETEPPPRFSEASLIKTLEDKGIGRPSTYASIVSTLLYRGYIIKEKRSLVTTPLGLLVTDILVPHFPEIFAVEFTAKMENDLDRVEEGEITWRAVLEEFWPSFKKALDAFAAKAEELKASVPEDIPLYYKGQSRYGKRRGKGKWRKKK